MRAVWVRMVDHRILKRGVHEATGEADLALRYAHTVPLARVVGTYGSNKLPFAVQAVRHQPGRRADHAGEGHWR